MNKDEIEAQWEQLSGELKVRWGKLTDDDLKIVRGNIEYLTARLQERYGISRKEAKKQISAFDSRNAYPFRPVSSLSHLNTQQIRRNNTTG
ncbi:MAG TPA: CsbD family protein [Rhodanobacteraceae bacterium]|nr:CsbD family protein [Rhodanobacteraceae bacterium]